VTLHAVVHPLMTTRLKVATTVTALETVTNQTLISSVVKRTTSFAISSRYSLIVSFATSPKVKTLKAHLSL